ncbi:hypothetical protein PybrP1_004101 [[Pythium] brassicae (nom. inval.)]|nr:hypothetical protein PybrP1_004101 [[Pythium] brassicae (nom. inval.)]
MSSRVMDITTPAANYENPSSPTSISGASTQGNSPFHRLARAWFALRWRLAEIVFSRPLPWITANLDLKVGDVVVTLPVAIGFVVYNAVQCSKLDVSASGPASMVLMVLVFALTVRNNSILLSVTGLPFERALLYHKFFGVVLVVVTGLHGLAYLLEDAGVMAARRSRRRLREFKEPALPMETSGAIAFYLLATLWVFSLSPIRRRFYEFFLRAHVLLFIGIVVFSVIHGAGLVLVGVGIWALDAVFRHGYLVPRHFKGSPGCTAQLGVVGRGQFSAVKLPGKIVRLQFPRVRTDTGECFRYEAGQYAFVCVPALGYLEWHPFTISSSPHEALVTIHIKALGDWTRRLLALVSAQASSDRDIAAPAPAPFALLVDGCYGRVSIDIANPATYEHAVLFSGGIGVTPMQSIANQLYFEYHHNFAF